MSPFKAGVIHDGLGSQPTHRALFTVRPDMVYVFKLYAILSGNR